MEIEPGNFGQLASVSKRVIRRVLTVGENRLELLLVELQEERERLLLALLMALGIAAFGLLAGISFTLIIVIAFMDHSPLIAMAVLTLVYIGMAIFLFARLARLKREWQTLPASMDQLRKDRECLEHTLT